MGEILTSASRVSDIPCRFGGEEFCVILPDTDDEQSFIWAERVCRTIRETKIETRQGPLSITASIGTATLVRGATSIDAALEQADAGCIEAKSRGRDQVVVMTAATALNTTKEQSQNSMLENVRASDVMSTILMTIPRSTTVASAARLMLECQCEAIPVVTSEGTLRGLLTNEEIVSHILRKGNWEDEIDSIAGQTVTFPEDTPFDKVWGVFQRLPIRRAVVTQDEKPIGVIIEVNSFDDSPQLLSSTRHLQARMHLKCRSRICIRYLTRSSKRRTIIYCEVKPTPRTTSKTWR